MSDLVAWKGGNGMFSKWHITPDRRFTACGKEIPMHPSVPPHFAPLGARPLAIAGLCGTCRERHPSTLTLETS